MTSRMSFSCHRYTPGRSKTHSKCFLGMLLSPKNITEYSTYNNSSLTTYKWLRCQITRFAAYFYRNISKMTSRMSFSCHRYTPGRSKIHPKCFLDMLLSPKNITEDSTYNKNSLSSVLMTMLCRKSWFSSCRNFASSHRFSFWQFTWKRKVLELRDVIRAQINMHIPLRLSPKVSTTFRSRDIDYA